MNWIPLGILFIFSLEVGLALAIFFWLRPHMRFLNVNTFFKDYQKVNRLMRTSFALMKICFYALIVITILGVFNYTMYAIFGLIGLLIYP